MSPESMHFLLDNVWYLTDKINILLSPLVYYKNDNEYVDVVLTSWSTT